MSYTVHIKDKSTGITRDVEQDLEWNDDHDASWTVGNFSCDCNRHDEFHGRDGTECPCGDWSRYFVSHVTLPDGTEVMIDDPQDS